MQIHEIYSLIQENFETYKAEMLRRQTKMLQNQQEEAIFLALLTPEQLEKKIDEIFSRPKGLPLKGIPFAVKDNIDVKGFPTTAGCPEYAFQPEESAFAVRLLEEAGAVCIGKTNLDQFATGLNGTRSPHGTAVNFYHEEYIPGGSSSGSASSVSWGYACFALGTDTAGSGRIPAAFQNLTGIKPSRGIVSTEGVVPACRSLDCVTIFTRTPKEAEQVLRVMTCFNPRDPYARLYQSAALPQKTSIAVPRREDLRFFGDKEYEENYNTFIGDLKGAGFSVVEADFSPLFQAAELLYGGPWIAERYHAVGRFIEDHPGSVLENTRSIILSGKAPSAKDYFEAEYKLKALAGKFEEMKKQFSLFLTPTAGRIYTKKEMTEDPVELNTNLGYYTNFMNLLDCSALALPISFTKDGLPFGVTVFSSAMQESQLFDFASLMEDKSLLSCRSRTEGWIDLAVCGAHKRSGSLNPQMLEAGAVYSRTADTADEYRLYALENFSPVRPGLVHEPEKSGSVEVEIWKFPSDRLGAFINSVSGPLCFGKVKLKDGKRVCSFLCEPYATRQAKDITHLKRWETYIESLK